MITIIKLGLLLLISLWYVTVKLHDRPNVLFSNLDVEKPWTFILTFIWPEPHPWLEKLALKRESGEEVPLWAQCDRSGMFCNGTFVTATREWLARGELSESIFGFLKEESLFCIYDIADFVFCAVFYCILLWVLWDVFFYFIQCVVSVADDEVVVDADEGSEDADQELQVLM